MAQPMPRLVARASRLPLRLPGVAEVLCWLAAAGLLAATLVWPSLGDARYDALERQAAAALARRATPPAAAPEAPAVRLSASAAP